MSTPKNLPSYLVIREGPPRHPIHNALASTLVSTHKTKPEAKIAANNAANEEVAEGKKNGKSQLVVWNHTKDFCLLLDSGEGSQEGDTKEGNGEAQKKEGDFVRFLVWMQYGQPQKEGD
jgi:hypothetical protein